MKKFPLILAALVLALALAACGGADAPETSAPAPQPEPESVASAPESIVPIDAASDSVITPEDRAYRPEPDFLTAEQEALYFAALDVYLDNMGPDYSKTFRIASFDTSELPTIEVNGNHYNEANGDFTTLAELKDYYYSVFTPEYADELMGKSLAIDRFVEQDGKLWFIWGGRGTHIGWTGEPDEYSYTGGDDTRVDFNVIGHYEDYETGEPYAEAWPIVMNMTDDGWRVSLFNITY